MMLALCHCQTGALGNQLHAARLAHGGTNRCFRIAILRGGVDHVDATVARAREDRLQCRR